MDAAQIAQKLYDNADFALPWNADKARRYYVAATQALSLGVPPEMWHNGERLRYEFDFLKDQIARIEQTFAATSSSYAKPEVVLGSMRCFRD